jgi:uncharacterized protein (TIGR02001 family)
MMMKKNLTLLIGAVGLASLAAAPALAAGLTGNAAVTTNYMWRGISQSADKPAVQAGLDYDFGNGFAVGTWASSIDFGNSTPMEWDIYGSYSGAITDQLGYTAGVIGYVYPDTPHSAGNYNFYEIYGGLSYDFKVAKLTGKIYYSPDFGNGSYTSLYYTGGVSVPLVDWLSATANIGYSDFSSAPAGVKNYTDWNIGLAATYDKYTLSGTYADSDLPGSSGKFLATVSFVTP